MKTWNEIQSAFVPDGALRDITIENTDESIWNLFIHRIVSSQYIFHFTHGGKVMALPRFYGDIRALQKTDPTVLKILIGEGIDVNCHFFVKDEIEMDLSPDCVGSESQYNCLIYFLQWLSSELHRPVKLTHENSENDVIVNVEL